MTAQLQQRTDGFFQDARPGGAVLVRRGDEVLLRKAYGLADVENQVAMKPEMVFRLASATEQFTAVAILRLVEAGKLELDQPLRASLPDLPDPIGGVTLCHLLTHTSGIRNISSNAQARSSSSRPPTAVTTSAMAWTTSASPDAPTAAPR